MTHGTLYYGDNLEVMKRYIADETVDLVYLDPPFNSNQNYNVLFKEQDGKRAASQIQAFEDTWTWDIEDATVYAELITRPGKLSDLLQGFYKILGGCNLMAYLVMMAPRLVELKRVMKPTASIYLHCDPTASHYLKLLMDAVFGAENFINELIWKRSDAHSDSKQGSKHFGRIHDVILFYSKSDKAVFNTQYNPLSESTANNWYSNIEPDTGRRYNKADMTGPGGAAKGNPYYEWKGVSRYWRYSKENMQRLESEGRIVYSKSGMPYQKRYLDESKGVALQDLWDDIGMLRGISQNKERLGYPTQKPIALLERIINSSCPENGTVLDPFCGCGTTIAASQKLNRHWIGIDITHIAVTLMKNRLKDMFGIEPFSKKNPDGYIVVGEPTSLPDAQALADADKYQFQYWALGLVGARPDRIDEKKGADKGIDGKIIFLDEAGNQYETVIISVKAGKTGVAHIRDLRGVIDREKAAIGVLLTMQEPTLPMKQEADGAGFYHSVTWGKKYPKIQILTIESLMAENKADIAMPPIKATFRKAEKVTTDGHSQLGLI